MTYQKLHRIRLYIARLYFDQERISPSEIHRVSRLYNEAQAFMLPHEHRVTWRQFNKLIVKYIDSRLEKADATAKQLAREQ